MVKTIFGMVLISSFDLFQYDTNCQSQTFALGKGNFITQYCLIYHSDNPVFHDNQSFIYIQYFLTYSSKYEKYPQNKHTYNIVLGRLKWLNGVVNKF